MSRSIPCKSLCRCCGPLTGIGKRKRYCLWTTSSQGTLKHTTSCGTYLVHSTFRTLISMYKMSLQPHWTPSSKSYRITHTHSRLNKYKGSNTSARTGLYQKHNIATPFSHSYSHDEHKHLNHILPAPKILIISHKHLCIWMCHFGQPWMSSFHNGPYIPYSTET